MKSQSTSLKENITKFILFASIGFVIALVSSFLIKLFSLILLLLIGYLFLSKMGLAQKR